MNAVSGRLIINYIWNVVLVDYYVADVWNVNKYFRMVKINIGPRARRGLLRYSRVQRSRAGRT